jgi:hypothetical protein
MKTLATDRNGERGQTIAIVAITLVALIGFAALGIEVVALYVAHAEAQRTADAAALAGASIFASSSFTSAPGSFTASEVCATGGGGSSSAVNKLAAAAVAENLVSNQPATITNVNCVLVNGDPQVTVTVKRSALPTFFSRIWGATSPSVTVQATAEAYNASGRNVPVQVTGVKPWLLPNCDFTGAALPPPPCTGQQFVDRTAFAGSGAVANSGSFIGKLPPIRPLTKAAVGAAPAAATFYTLDLGTPSHCPDSGAPSCGNLHASDYWDNIACSSPVQMNCGDQVGLGTAYPVISGVGTRQATQCLINADSVGTGQGQDVFQSGGGPPITIDGGYNNPVSGLQGVQNISRSDSVVTVPLFDPSQNPNVQQVPIIGFLQLGITETPSAGKFTAVVMNAVGCDSGAAGIPVSASTTPVGVRLIHQ